jgi:hypothetical protein
MLERDSIRQRCYLRNEQRIEAMKRNFSVEAIWDAEAKVYISRSDIVGLHIEAATIEEFEEVLHDVATELIVANHLTATIQ